MKKILLAALIAFATGCAPGLGTEVEVTALPLSEKPAGTYWMGQRVRINKFNDNRTERESIEMKDRRVEIVGDLGGLVQGGLSDAIRTNGGSLCLFDCPYLEGDIIEWSLKAVPNFPTTKVTSRAQIVVRAYGVDGKLRYTGRYSGSMSGEHPYYNEQRLLDAFGMSMNEAINSAIEDPKLYRLY